MGTLRNVLKKRPIQRLRACGLNIKAFTEQGKCLFRSGKSTYFSAIYAQKVSILGKIAAKKLLPYQNN